MGETTTELLIGQYVSWLQTWASPRTIGSRRTLITSRLKEWGLDGFTEKNISEFMARPKADGKPRSRWTKATYHNHLTDFCNWLVAAGYLEDSPMDKIRKPKRPPAQPRPLSEAEVEKVLGVVEGQTRDWILLALLAGLRASEIAKIRGDDVNADGIYVEGKGGTIVTLPCHPDLWDMAQRYPHHDYWFPGSEDGHTRSQQVSLVVGKLFHALGIQGSIHRCRHVFGTRLLRKGINIRTVQKLMRHASLDTTANYTAVDEDEMRAAINLLPTAS